LSIPLCGEIRQLIMIIKKGHGWENLNNVYYPTKGDYHYQDGERSETAVGAGDRCGSSTSLRELDNIYWFTNSQVSCIDRALVTILLATLTPGGAIF